MSSNTVVCWYQNYGLGVVGIGPNEITLRVRSLFLEKVVPEFRYKIYDSTTILTPEGPFTAIFELW